MSQWCSFPRCSCFGLCAFADYEPPAVVRKGTRPGCLFPNCSCGGSCCDSKPKKKPEPQPVHEIISPRGNVVRGFKQIVHADWDGYPCAYCGAVMVMGHRTLSPTIDHVLPRVHGGGNVLSNTEISCWMCNHMKANQTLEQWHLSLRHASDHRRAECVAEVLKKRSSCQLEDSELAQKQAVQFVATQSRAPLDAADSVSEDTGTAPESAMGSIGGEGLTASSRRDS